MEGLKIVQNKRDLTDFKKELKEKFPQATLAKVMDIEPDTMTDAEFLIKFVSWIKLREK